MRSVVFKTQNQSTQAVKFKALVGRKTVGRIFLYLIYNQLHHHPYGLLEDLFVEPEFRQLGIGSKLVELAIEKARELDCYKLIGTSRFSRPLVHKFYETGFGFKKYGYEFRLDL